MMRVSRVNSTGAACTLIRLKTTVLSEFLGSDPEKFSPFKTVVSLQKESKDS
jgi:hypothetical protein